MGKANIKGVEGATGIPIAQDWNLNLNYTYTDSERKSDDEKLGNGISLKGYPLDKTPKHIANAKLDWNFNEDLTLYTHVRIMKENRCGQHNVMVLKCLAIVVAIPLWMSAQPINYLKTLN